MYDKDLVVDILAQIDAALERITNRSARYKSPVEFVGSEAGLESLDSIYMLFIAVGEALKNIDKITKGSLLSQYPEIDWKGVMGFRDIVAHHYFDIDAAQVFWICENEVMPLSSTIKKMLSDLK